MNETTFAPDPSGGSAVHVRRGGPVPPGAGPAAEAAAWWRAALAGDDVATAALSHPDSDTELVEAALAGDGSVLGAAVLAELLHHGLAKKAGGRVATWWIADAWWLRGPAFAVRAAAGLSRIVYTEHYGAKPFLRRRTGVKPYFETAFHPLFRRLRGILAAASDADYAAATEALAGTRTDLTGKVVASYLVPTREDWAGEVAAETASLEDYGFDWRSVLHSLSTPAQLEAVPAAMLHWRLMDEECRRTLLDGMGAASAPAFARAADADPNGGDSRKKLLAVLAELPGDEAFELLVARLGQKHVQQALFAAMGRDPVRAVRLLARAAASTAGYASEAGFLLRSHVAAHPDVVTGVLPELDGAERAQVERALRGEDRLPVVSGDALPRVLVDPPWAHRRAAAAKPVVLKGLSVDAEPKLSWLPGEQADWAGWRARLHRSLHGGWRRAAAEYDAGKLAGWEAPILFLEAPGGWVRERLDGWRPGDPWEGELWGRVLASRHGLLAYRPLVATAKANPRQYGEVLLPYASPEIAGLVADWLVRLKTAGPVALAWLERHAAEAAAYLVPPALGPAGQTRHAAESALRQLARGGQIGRAHV